MAMSIIPQSSLPVVLNGVYIRQDEVGRFRLNDLHIAAGGEKRHQPSDWLRLQQTQEVIQVLSQKSDAPGIPGAKQNQPLSVVYNGGSQEQGTYVCKELVYSYAMWVKPEFHVDVIRTYDQVAQYGFAQVIARHEQLFAEHEQLRITVEQLSCKVDRLESRPAKAVFHLASSALASFSFFVLVERLIRSPVSGDVTLTYQYGELGMWKAIHRV